MADEENNETEDGVPVYNPVHDADRQYRWALFMYKYVEPDIFYQMFVLEDPEKILYFHANCIVWCLGYKDIEDTIKNVIPASDVFTGHVGPYHGTFMTKEGVRNLINATKPRLDSEAFGEWFEEYLTKCENNTVIDVLNTCPA